MSISLVTNLCNKAWKYRVKRSHHHILICPFSAHCPIVYARARNILSWQCPRPPVPETSMPGCARAKKLCPLNITNFEVTFHSSFSQKKLMTRTNYVFLKGKPWECSSRLTSVETRLLSLLPTNIICLEHELVAGMGFCPTDEEAQ